MQLNWVCTSVLYCHVPRVEALADRQAHLCSIRAQSDTEVVQVVYCHGIQTQHCNKFFGRIATGKRDTEHLSNTANQWHATLE